MSDQEGQCPDGAVLAQDALHLLGNLDDCEDRWAELEDDELDTEVDRYRDSIRAIRKHLESLGVSPEELEDDDEVYLVEEEPEEEEGEEEAAAASADEPPPTTSPSPSPQPPEVPAAEEPPKEFAHLGEEGVDFTLGSVDDIDPKEWQVPPHCIPIHANVTTYDWKQLYSHTQFDVIMMDPPWQLATANPTRGVSLGYSQLSDNDIINLPVPALQSNGFLFVWVINAKYKFTLDLFERWGYRLVDEVVWVKMTVNRRLAKSHGYYLQHAKEVCLVGLRGQPPQGALSSVASDVLFSERRGQSQKPEEVYELIEQLVPGGRYLEIFARKNNLRNFWVSVGNEVTGTGLPEEDMQAFQSAAAIPGAKYGRSG